MSVTVKVSPSTDPYICVATDVPGGSKYENWSTIFFLHDEEKTDESISTHKEGYVRALVSE